ncbi:hypothetical protein OSTOST_06657 [Ostertagia ostertagi]
MLSTIDSSSLTPIDTEKTPQMQIRTILRRKGVNSAVKRGIENASVRYDALLSFVRTQENCEELQQEVDRFWNEQQGEKLIEDAQILITTLDAQLLIDESLQNILSLKHSDEIVTATAALTISDTGRPQDNQPAQEHQNPNQDALPSTPKQDTPCSVLQPIQPRRLELPTFDGDGSAALIVQGYDPSTPENYQLAVQALRRRYDRPQVYPQPFPSEKFPRETQLEVYKLEHRSGKTWTLPELLDGLNEVIEEVEKLEDYSVTPVNHSEPREYSI